ncbi:LacI family DNA-binding transcriptional regulator [Consotaella aegiceratis]|uniref:LacI family DNA-binding transcriptional regulator n=1 Tax=Consotaella aegiceratis TaxID=3097961 RepID=UPI002F42EED9
MTLKDVAREANVSVAAASYAMRDSGTVSREMREHVREVAARLGYRPNRSAQAVRMGRNTTLGLLLPDLRNPYFPALAQSLEHEARRAGYTVMLIDTSGAAESEIDGMRHLENQGVAGAIWCRTSNAEHLEALPHFAMPVAVIGTPDAGYDNVTTRDLEGGRQLARHLIDHGHRSLGLITSADIMEGKDDRKIGFLAEAEGKAKIGWQVQTSYAVHLPQYVFEKLKERSVTAVMCGNDMIAIGVLRAAHELGLRVPDDLSVVGFDDISWASIVVPALTTVRQPVDQMAASAMTLLLNRLAEPERRIRHYKVDVRLISRQSVATIPAAAAN